ncbi:MAG: DUF4129 domain-containing protein [Chloroflexota bacterium]
MLANFRSAHKRQIILAAAGLALLALTLLAAGLTRTEFRSAEQYVEAEPTAAEETAPRLQPLPAPPPSGNEIFILLALATLLAVIGLMNREGRKRVLWSVLWFSFMLLVAYVLSSNSEAEATGPLDALRSPDLGAGPVAVKEATEVAFDPPRPASWINYLVSFALVSLLGAGGWFLWRWLKPPAPTPLQEIGYVARMTLSELESGSDWQDAVVRAYVRMSEVVNRQRGLQRPEGMTASEFTLRLERAGLPADSVRRLTRLFESVRYGGRSASQDQVIEASNCLTSIMEACGVEA